jgi:cytochrome c biogenesis protein CcdA
VTSPLGAFFAGFVITLFELPCTGGPYFFVIGLLAQSESITSIIPTLLFYNLVFVLPLILIVFAVYFGVSSVEKAEAWKEKNIRVLHLIAGIIMLALGLWVFFI